MIKQLWALQGILNFINFLSRFLYKNKYCLEIVKYFNILLENYSSFFDTIIQIELAATSLSMFCGSLCYKVKSNKFFFTFKPLFETAHMSLSYMKIKIVGLKASFVDL